MVGVSTATTPVGQQSAIRDSDPKPNLCLLHVCKLFYILLRVGGGKFNTNNNIQTGHRSIAKVTNYEKLLETV